MFSQCWDYLCSNKIKFCYIPRSVVFTFDAVAWFTVYCWIDIKTIIFFKPWNFLLQVFEKPFQTLLNLLLAFKNLKNIANKFNKPISNHGRSCSTKHPCRAAWKHPQITYANSKYETIVYIQLAKAFLFIESRIRGFSLTFFSIRVGMRRILLKMVQHSMNTGF